MKQEKIAVIMSVYEKDSLYHLKMAVESVINQTYDNLDLYIYMDGVKRIDILNYLKLINDEHSNIFLYKGVARKGLAYALNFLLQSIKKSNQYSYIARMDADDISCHTRFYEQVSYYRAHPEISVLGSNCMEINDLGENIFLKKMPESHEDIRLFIFKRSPLVHPSVIFRFEIIDDIKYNPRLKQSQDYFLWVDLLAKGYKFGNVQKCLMQFRVSENFYSRRGSKKIFNEVKGRLYAMRKFKSNSVKNYMYIFFLVILRVSPTIIKKICYRVMR